MIVDLDYSFIRLRDNFEDAIDTNYSPAADIGYAGFGIQLMPSEPILQISNSPTNISLETFNVHIINLCQEVLEDVTSAFFITPFTDTNGISQITWEWINESEYYNQVVVLRFTDTGSGSFYYTNPFLTTASNNEPTVRFDYRSAEFHYGTQYDRAGNNLDGTIFYQSIRLKAYYNNKVNESERQEYHQISTNVTISARNIKKWKERYLLDSWDDFTIERLETLVTNDEVYVDTVRSFSSDPIEFTEREGDSDMSEKECLLNKDYTQTYTFDFQIWDGLNTVTYDPFGSYATGTTFSEYSMTFQTAVTLTGTGQVDVYNSSDVLLVSYPSASFSVVGGVKVVVDATGTDGEDPTDDSYYCNVSAGFVTTLGVDNEAITDKTTWAFELQGGDYAGADFNSTDYLT
ncbi:MAG: hypothetical protein GY928_01935 [Colwellia sp.]|nr:hypothetical protein [Colwellia sp.]